MSLTARLAVMTLLAATVLLGAACRRSDPPQPTATPPPLTSATGAAPVSPATLTPAPTPVPIDPAELLREAGEAVSGLSSFHFRLEHDKGSTEITTGLFVEDAEGDVVNPDRISVEFSGTFGTGFAIRARLITVMDTSYMTNPLSGKWEAVPVEVSPLGFFSPTRGIAAMTAQVNDPRLLDEAAAKGAYRIAGLLPTSALSSLLGKTLPGASVAVELSIDAETLFLTKARIVGNVTSSDEDNLVRIITLSAFNEPVLIEAPTLE